MNTNVGIQNVGILAWNQATAYPADLRKFVRFGWSFEVVAAIAADAVFKFQSAPPSDADTCVPGAWTDVEDIVICDRPANPGIAQVTIPAGTPVGTICAGTLPCKPDAFIRMAAVSGTTASVRAVLIRQGPMI